MHRSAGTAPRRARGHSLARLLFPLLLCACRVEYTPLEIADTPQALTAKNLNLVQQRSLPYFAPFSFAVMSDTHAYYVELERAVASINRRSDIAFVLFVGDLTDHGLLQEYEWTVDIARTLDVPYLTVIGNHDALSNGKENYQAIFGPFDYSFVFNQVKFVALNANAREFGSDAPRLDWLALELADFPLYRHQILFSHVIPKNFAFEPTVEEQFSRLLKENFVSMAIAGHTTHEYSEEILANGETIGYLISAPVKDGAYYIVTVAEKVTFSPHPI